MMQDYQAISAEYLHEYLLASTMGRPEPTHPIIWMSRKKSRRRLSRILSDDAKESLLFLAGVVIVGGLVSLALSPYWDRILSWI